jgi:hypothetical protein
LLAQESVRTWPDVPTATGGEEAPGFIIHAHLCISDDYSPKDAAAGLALPKVPGSRKDLISPRDADKALKACRMRTAGTVLRGAACWHMGHAAQQAARDLQSWLDR